MQDLKTARTFYKSITFVIFLFGLILAYSNSEALTFNESYTIQTTQNLPHHLGTYRHIIFNSNNHITFDEATLSNNYHAYIYEQPSTIQTQAKCIGELAQELNYIMGINGGFYAPDFSPVGLFISKGFILQPVAQDPLALSCIYTDRSGKLYLENDINHCATAYNAMQTGPSIIEQGNISSDVTELPKKLLLLNLFFEPRLRTVLAQSRDKKLIIITTSDATLLDIATILKQYPSAFGVKNIITAVDMDGGRSTGMYIQFHDYQFYKPEQKRVRTFIFFN